MRQSFRFAKHALALVCAVALNGPVQARMVELEDGELSDITGQAFINLTTDNNAGINYTRVNFGVNVDTQLNIKKLQLGQYNRAGEAAGSSDILINNFALGTVGPNDTINPFKITNPFLELAYDGNRVVGVRIGFGEAKGVLSGDIQSLTGNIPVHIKGTGDAIYNKSNFLQQSALFLAGVYRSSIVEADATLVNSGGVSDPVRGTMSGIKNGDGLNCTSGCAGGWTDALLGAFASSNCSILGIQTCFNLSQFQSLPVGNTSDMSNMQNAAKGFFISLQTQDLAWRDMDSNALITTLQGAFLNLPKYRDANGNLVSPINIDFNQAFNGIPRQDTCLGTATAGC
ncbi:hypothetical protein H7683_04205 [Ectopseudomonas mendocina]|uniref:hypothetical protein n=1 Tax=Ectopseudomonas mendocina TaxID=300 RepID=UPI001AE0CFB7|nr:hypothetical protein [Pseudomonas mendocina]QTN46844.1 hypothetical protein H7683_04205 [Pseudomonas mendocina]